MKQLAERLHKSTDDGENWQKVAYAGYRDVSDILVVGPDDIFLAVSMDSDSSGALCYHNGTWLKIRVPAYGGSLAQKGNTLVVGTWDGVWRIDDIITAVKKRDETIPSGFVLSQNFPNPFNPSTTIEFSLPKRSYVNLTIYNALGQNIETLISSEMGAGSHRVIWNAEHYPSGTYFARFEANGFIATKKTLLVK